jgi:acyl-CoA thioesterase FadM
MASTETVAEKELYELTRRDCLVAKTKFGVVIQLGYVGNSSLSSIAKLITQPEGKVLVTNTNQVVTVDKTTRKPTTLSEWWKERYHSYGTTTKPLIVAVLAVPEITHSYSVKVPWTDIDNYKHTNYIAYIRYCIDAAMDATAAKVYTKVKHDFLQYPIQSMRISYKGESVANDNLVVKTWENQENPLILHFSIDREGVILFQSTMQVFPAMNKTK